MSNAVLISIRPKWCAKIANGKKTIEVRKSRPKLETPFKCYIYCTAPKKFYKISEYMATSSEYLHLCDGKVTMSDGFEFCGRADYKVLNRKVIGEFVCDSYIGWGVNPLDGLYMIFPNELQQACLTGTEFEQYGNGKTLYGWHISALQIYDKPRELNEFWVERDATTDYPPFKRLKRPPQSWCYVEELT